MYLISAEILSNVNCVNCGLLGFLLITPRISTNRPSTAGYDAANVPFAVMITRITPTKHNTIRSLDAFRNKLDLHFMRYSFSATFSGVPPLWIRAKRAFRTLSVYCWMSAKLNLNTKRLALCPPNSEWNKGVFSE